MEMSIDEARYLIEHHKPNDVNNAYELGEAFCVAIDAMRKYERIKKILKDIPYGGEATVRRIQEVVEDGNGD